VHKTSSTDEKKLQTQLKRLGVNTIPGIEEVMLFNDDGTALSFTNPKVQASIAANTYVVSGVSQQKSAQEAMASMLSGSSIQQLMAQMGMQGGMPGGMGAMGGGDDDDEDDDDDDDDVPELVGNFDQPE
jgi:nascent polypeptide-associated complex subunit beta